MRTTLLVHIAAGGLGPVFWLSLGGVLAAFAALPVMAVLAAMAYWLGRVRMRRTFRPVADIGASEAEGVRVPELT